MKFTSADHYRFGSSRRIVLRVWVMTLVISLGAAFAPAAPPGSFAQVRGDQFVVGGTTFKLKGTNYYPRDHMWADMWDPFDLQEITREAVMIERLGLNCVRILVPYEKGGWNGPKTPSDRLSNLVQVVNTFGNHGIRSIVTLFDWETSFAPAGSKQEAEHFKYVTAIVDRLKDNPHVLMWDVKNEPDHPANLDGKSDDWKCCPEKREKIVDWLRRMCVAIKERDQNHPVGAGIRWYANVKETLAFVDVAMFHSYWHNIADEQIPTVKKALGDTLKPIVVEEYGLPTNPNPCNRDGTIVTDFSEKNQRDFLEKHLKAYAEHNIAGGLQWMTFDAAKYSTNPKEDFEKYFGLWRYDYSLKPAGEVYREMFKVKPFPRQRPAPGR